MAAAVSHFNWLLVMSLQPRSLSADR